MMSIFTFSENAAQFPGLLGEWKAGSLFWLMFICLRSLLNPVPTSEGLRKLTRAAALVEAR